MKTSPNLCITSRRAGFTLIELLAVVGILLLLLSLLIPGVKRAKDYAIDARCKSNLRQVVSLALNYASDNGGVFPCGRSRSPEVADLSDPLQQCFMGNEVLVGSAYEGNRLPSWPSGWPIGNTPAKPTWGTLFPYMGGDAALAKKLYRCVAQPEGVLRSGQDSNGFFDYSVIKLWMLATVGNLPTSAQMEFPAGSGVRKKMPTPWIMEENAATLNSAGYIEPGAAAVDRFGTWHYGHGNYGAVDGSVATVDQLPGRSYGPMPGDFTLKYPSGRTGPITGGNAANELWNNY